MSNRIVSAICDGLGETRVTTVKGLCDLLLSGSADHADVMDAFHTVRPAIREVAEAHASDVERARGLDGGLLDVLHGLTAGYAVLDDLLAELQAAFERGADYSDLLARIHEHGQILGDLQRSLSLWQSSHTAQCPRCGRIGQIAERHCTRCDIHMVIADPHPPPPRIPTFRAGPRHQAVYGACAAVASGQQPCAALLDTVEPLEAELTQASHALRLAMERNALQELSPEDAQQMLDLIARSLQGTEQIKRFTITLSVADLNQG